VLNRCDAVASKTVRKEPEFRRLIDDAKSELAKVSEAIEHRDAGQLRRIISSLRAIDNLLAFRFG
jgi:phosphate uptake regulator